MEPHGNHAHDRLVCLEGCDNVAACEVTAESHLRVGVERTQTQAGAGPTQHVTLTVEDGTLRLLQLREALATERARLGNNHWGDHQDVKGLCTALNIGMLMFCDTLQDITLNY